MPSLSDNMREYFEEQAGQDPDPTDFVYDSDVALGGATCASSLPAVAGKRNYVLGFAITCSAPAAIQTAVATLSGLFGSDLNFRFVQTTQGGTQMVVNFAHPLPASAVNTAITLTVPAVATGGIPATAIWGFVK